MSFNFKKMIILGIFNYFLRKYLKDFDYKILNRTLYDNHLYICNSCTRVTDINYFINFNKIPNCIYCKSDFVNISDHLLENTNNNNKNKILKL